ncbi:hypothetical protein EJB05_03140 [Eragrostis curvula]|uniref:Uncharacterized protein n=1 Tax=Eragrostis curvula TaxID=38414 RepID=A0A5J9WU25_9POAL|nr:hypothetical protein EJB05_03140 [Eragrostis curvula]
MDPLAGLQADELGESQPPQQAASPVTKDGSSTTLPALPVGKGNLASRRAKRQQSPPLDEERSGTGRSLILRPAEKH